MESISCYSCCLFQSVVKPDCWTEQQFREHEKKNPWMIVRVSDKALLCKTCIEASSVSADTTQGVRKSEEWTKKGVFAAGTDPLNSIRTKLSRHRRSKLHLNAEETSKTAKKNLVVKSIVKVIGK